MANGSRALIILLMISIFQTVPKVSFSTEVEFKISDGEYVDFIYQVALLDFKGHFLVDKSYFKIDFEKPEASMFQLYFDVNRSTAGFPLATRLMQSKAVLYSKKNPQISFLSNTIIRRNNSFIILGLLTIRGISKKIELIAKIDMQNQNEIENSSILNFDIHADIFRSDYGVDGYLGLVSNKIVLDSKITVMRIQ